MEKTMSVFILIAMTLFSMMVEEKAMAGVGIAQPDMRQLDGSTVKAECYPDKVVLRNTGTVPVETAYLLAGLESRSAVAEAAGGGIALRMDGPAADFGPGQEISVMLSGGGETVLITGLKCWG
jgi:hypothetical protein